MNGFYARYGKRVVDVFLSIFLLLLFAPLMVLIVVVLLLFSDENVFFSQRRPGLDGKIFWIYKFKTMSDHPINSTDNPLSDEERLTVIGKFLRLSSLDELPQLYNVLKGDMSLVGPRPFLEEYLPLYDKRQAKRHLVKPGITGWAQVKGRNAISWQDKFDFDVWYVENLSFWLDLKIIFMTTWKVFDHSENNQEGVVGMEKFKGNITT